MTRVLRTSLSKSKTAGRRLARGVRSGTATTRKRISALRHHGGHADHHRRNTAAGLAVPVAGVAAWAARRSRRK